jgi:hypothetical protein
LVVELVELVVLVEVDQVEVVEQVDLLQIQIIQLALIQYQYPLLLEQAVDWGMLQDLLHQIQEELMDLHLILVHH